MGKSVVHPEVEGDDEGDEEFRAMQRPYTLSTNGKVSIVQWETDIYYAHNAAGGTQTTTGVLKKKYLPTHMSIGITRLGCCGGYASVRWKTFDVSALKGKHYQEVNHELVEFADGETHKELIVQIKPCANFEGTLEFGIYLMTETAENCEIGRYLHTATIKIIDDACFPTENVRKEVEGGHMDQIAKVPPHVLLKEFRVAAMQNKVVRRGTMRMIWALQFGNVNIIVQIIIMLHVTSLLESEYVGRKDITDKQLLRGQTWLGFYALVYLIPFAIQHALDYSKNFWKVGGGLRKHLQTTLLRRYLNYTHDSRSEVAVERLVLAMTRDVVDVVSEAHITHVNLVYGALIRMVLLIGTMVYLSSSSGSLTWYPVIAVFSLPFIKAMFIKLIEGAGASIRQHAFLSENEMINHVIQVVLRFELLDNYDRRSYEVDKYTDLINSYNKAVVDFGAFQTNAKYFAPWITRLMVFVWLIYGGDMVLRGNVTLAVYLSTITLFKTLGSELDKAFQLYLRINNSYLSVAEITMYMNLEIDVPAKLQANRQRRAVGKALRQKERGQMGGRALRRVIKAVVAMNRMDVLHKLGEKEEHNVAVDNLPIQMNRVSFSYEHSSANPEHDAKRTEQSGSRRGKRPALMLGTGRVKKTMAAGTAKSLRDLSLYIEQGQLIALVGPKSEGKATLLRLLAGSIFPKFDGESGSSNMVFVPPHLRVVQVHENPTILGPKQTIFDNLIYGIKKAPNTDYKALEKRARGILKMLGAGDDLLENFNEPGFLGLNGMRITRTDRQLIHLGRAFVMNPEILLIYKPTNLLDPAHTETVINMLREFTRKRGILMPEEEPMIMRRRRTVIFTTSFSDIAKQADKVYEVRDGVISEQLKESEAAGDDISTDKKRKSMPSPLPPLKDEASAIRRAAKEEAKQLKKEIQSWLDDFKRENGRDITTEDKRAIKPLYDQYFLAVAKSKGASPEGHPEAAEAPEDS